MVICRPESVGLGMFWTDIQSDTTNNIVVQSSKGLFGGSFRILVHHGAKKHYLVAEADTLEEVMKDWAFIQNIVQTIKTAENSEPNSSTNSSSTNPPTPSDPTLTLVSLIYTRWKQSQEDSFIIRRVDNPPSSPSPLLPPASPLPPVSADAQVPPASPMASSTSTPEAPLPPPITLDLPPPPPPLSQTSPTMSSRGPPSPAPPSSPPPSRTPTSHPSFPTTTVATPVAALLSSSPPKPPSVTSLSPSLSLTPTLSPTPAPSTPSTPYTPVQSTTRNEYQEADNTVDPAIVAEVIAWEKRRSNLQTKLDALNRTKTRHLEGIVNDYLEAVRGIVMAEPGLNDQMKMNMVSQEYFRLESLKETVFSTKASAIISCVDSEIKSTERAGKIKRNVIKLQALTRGHLARKKYKPQLKARKQRNKCVVEFLETERTYVRLLELSVKVFLQPLKDSTTGKSALMRKEDVVTLFSNTESLLGINKEFLTTLEERFSHWSPNALLGDILVKFAPYMKIYTHYVNSYNDALNILNKYSKSPDFRDFLSKTKTNPELKSMDLASFLILPVQRIPRYVLLIQEIVKYTPTTHPDYGNLQKALEMIQEVAKTINESKRQAENTNKVMAIQASLIFGEKPLEDLVQPHRKFRKEGVLTREVDSAIEDCYLFLFSDILLITQKRKGFMDENYHYIFKDSMTFMRSTIKTIPDTRLWQHGFSLGSPSKSERFYAESVATKNEWMAAITEVIEEVKKNRQTLRVEELPEPIPPQPQDDESSTTPAPPSPPTTPTSQAPPPPPSLAHTSVHPHSHASHSHTHAHAHTHLSHKEKGERENSRKSLVLSSSSNLQPSATPAKLKQIVALYRQVLQLESEMFLMPYQIKMLLPNITVTPQNLQELNSRITLLSSRIIEIDNIQNSVLYIIREEKSVITLDKLINQGMVHIDSMLKFLTATFPKEMAPNAMTASRASLRQSSASNLTLSLPYQLMSSILSWYLSVSENWSTIMEKQVVNA